MQVEKMGLPTAPLVTIAFKDLAKSNAASRGMPDERICFLPHPMTNKSDEEMYKVLEGNDPVTNKPLMPEIIAALTQPLTADEKKTGTISPDIGPRTYSGTQDELQRLYCDNNYTDFMPIILPTEEKVEAMLKGTSHKPDEVIGELSAARGAQPSWKFTVKHVAINAVMAGASPEHLPVILAISSTGQPSLFSSTSSFTRMVMLNGPISDQIKMNYAIGAMGPFAEANAVIGRAWTILSKNLGGCGVAGLTYLGTLGSNFNYNNLCIAETENRLPDGWKPFHVQKGFKPDESVVSIFSGWSLNNIAWFPATPYHELIKNWLTHFFSFGTGAATVMLDPTIAREAKEKGFNSKEELSDYWSKNTKTPAWLYWDQHRPELKQAQAGVEPYASYLKMGDADIPFQRFYRRGRFGAPPSPEEAANPKSSIEVIVLGGETNTYFAGGDFSYVTSASVDKWR
jgi:hypothetical protein